MTKSFFKIYCKEQSALTRASAYRLHCPKGPIKGELAGHKPDMVSAKNTWQ